MSSNHLHLEPPAPPFSSLGSASGRGSPRSLTPPSSVKNDVSLTVNYLPTKFSLPHSAGVHKRKGKGAIGTAEVPKRGGGREAFRTGEARMPGEGDEDYDGVMPRQSGKTKPRLRWNKFKWALFLTNTIVSRDPGCRQSMVPLAETSAAVCLFHRGAYFLPFNLVQCLEKRRYYSRG
jgi:hypothetical protein